MAVMGYCCQPVGANGVIGCPDPALAEKLTDEQREIAALVTSGRRKEAPALLGIEPEVFYQKLHRLIRRLEVRDLTGLTKYAIRAGLTSPDYRNACPSTHNGETPDKGPRSR